MKEVNKFDQNIVVAGPILRRITSTSLCLWLAVKTRVSLKLELFPDVGEGQSFLLTPDTEELKLIQAGERLFYALIYVPLKQPLLADQWVEYRLSLKVSDLHSCVDLNQHPLSNQEFWDHKVFAPDLCYPSHSNPKFKVPGVIKSLIHGSCRKPHHESGDGLVQADQKLADILSGKDDSPWPSLLMLSGDQIYADDVAGPMLVAIHQLIEALGLFDESLGGLIENIPESGSALYQDSRTYYQREQLLPKLEQYSGLLDVLFRGVEKPIFTSVSAQNHLITLAEVLCLYLLVWSPGAWSEVEITLPPQLQNPENQRLQERFQQELQTLEDFKRSLNQVRRLMAHLPVAMIFDDHDVTDDWNLNRAWEEAAYSHPLSKRVIGNALVAYWLNQGWGNAPEIGQSTYASVKDAIENPGRRAHEACIDQLLVFQGWDFQWSTSPMLLVLDTRTRRWRSERSAHKPSGLIDWEAITELQQRLMLQDRVILVSAAPIFGVKLIESLQKMMTFLGKPLLVDAEYWMAHPGTANGLLNVFAHSKTPQRFTILSGDVHYSFVYDVALRSRNGPKIWQICSSGFKNEFPKILLAVLDRMNRWLYSPKSPLNLLTKRRSMRVAPRKPQGAASGRRLFCASGFGWVEFDEQGQPKKIQQCTTTGDVIEFLPKPKEMRWG